MIFYPNFFSNSNDVSNLNIVFEKKLSKIDKDFIRYLLNYYESSKETFVSVSKFNLKTLLKCQSLKEVEVFLEKFMKQKIYYSFENSENYMCKGIFHILDSYFIEKDNIIFILSREILMSFDKTTIFNKINIKTILEFESNSTLLIYLKLINSGILFKNSVLEFEIENLKDLLNIKNSYERFYDFETKILEPIANDLNTYSQFNVTFEKVKKKEAISSKVIAIKFYCQNKQIKEIEDQVNKLIFLIKDKIENFDATFSLLFKYLEKYSFEYVYENVVFVSKKEYSKKLYRTFNDFLDKALTDNLCYLYHEEKENEGVVIEKFIHSPFDLHNEIMKGLEKLNLLDSLGEGHLFLGSFVHNIYQLKDGESYEFKGSGVKLKVTYYRNKKSRIEVSLL